MLNKKNIAHFIIALYCLICFGSYLTYVYPWLSKALLILALISLTRIKLIISNNRILLFVLLSVLYIHSSISFINGFNPREVAILLPLLAFIDEDDFKGIFRYFVKLQVISLIPSLFVLASTIIGYKTLFPSHLVDWGRPFLVYPGTVTQPDQNVTIGGITFFRIAGIQGEPGGVGAVNLFILIAEQFNLKTKRNKFLLITGLISFSFAFYLLLVIYLALSYLFDSQIKKRILKVKWLILILISLLFASGFFEFYIENRVNDIDFNNSSAKNLRVEVPVDEYFDFFFKQDIDLILIGHGGGANSTPNSYKGARGINFMAYLYNYGLVGFLLLFITIYYLFKINRTKSMIPLFIILVSFYQRPSMVNIGYFLLFFAIAYNNVDNFSNQEQNIEIE